jgi:peptidoglycan lytic transglycosylase D
MTTILHCLFRGALLIVALSWSNRMVLAEQAPFAIPEGLAGAVQFWKQIFTRYDSDDVALFDPLDPRKIYSVLRVPENQQGRARVSKERARIALEYDLIEDGTRIRSQRGAKNHLIEGLKISGRYMTAMQNIMRAEGLPVELAYLPLVESSFNIRARSTVGAVGMWQFMPETGKKFMRIDSAVDERRDPLASTRAAARLLKQNFQILGSWPLAITAYNHGTEGIFRAIGAVGSRDLVKLIRRYDGPNFGFASKNFYAEFLAVVDIAANRESYFPYLREHRPVRLLEVSLGRPAALHAVLKPAAISHSDFFAWNPALEPNTKVLPLDYRVRLPAEKVDSFLAAHGRMVDAPAVKKTAGAKARVGNATALNQVQSVKRTERANSPRSAGKAKTSRSVKRQGVKA